MFSINHLIILAICATLISVSTVLSIRFRLSTQKTCIIFTIICVISETVKDLINMIPSEFGGCVLDQNDIPFHLCSLIVFAMLFIVLGKNKKSVNNVLCAVIVLGLIAPVFALLIPTEGVALGNIITYQYFIYHSALMWFALHNIITGAVDMGVRAYLRNLAYAAGMLFVSIYLNSMLAAYGVNFCFSRKPPVDDLPILNLNHGWYCYFAVLLMIILVTVTSVHLPFIIRNQIKAKKQSVNN